MLIINAELAGSRGNVRLGETIQEVSTALTARPGNLFWMLRGVRYYLAFMTIICTFELQPLMKSRSIVMTKNSRMLKVSEIMSSYKRETVG